MTIVIIHNNSGHNSGRCRNEYRFAPAIRRREIRLARFRASGRGARFRRLATVSRLRLNDGSGVSPPSDVYINIYTYIYIHIYPSDVAHAGPLQPLPGGDASEPPLRADRDAPHYRTIAIR